MMPSRPLGLESNDTVALSYSLISCKKVILVRQLFRNVALPFKRLSTSLKLTVIAYELSTNIPQLYT
jgi:hypothetical protein